MAADGGLSFIGPMYGGGGGGGVEMTCGMYLL